MNTKITKLELRTMKNNQCKAVNRKVECIRDSQKNNNVDELLIPDYSELLLQYYLPNNQLVLVAWRLYIAVT